MPIIPTRYSSKLPRHLSHPIGAEAVSEALAGSPHAEASSLWFACSPVWRTSESRRLFQERLPYDLMTAIHHPASKPGIGGAHWMIQEGWYDECWELRVNPVLSEFRSLANRLLRDEGLPSISSWLKSSGRRGWAATSRQLALTFDPAAETLSCRESIGV